MALGSSEDTVAILYDNENTSFEMLDFALKEAERFLPCRLIVIADWDECPDQKRWQKLMSRPGFTFRQIERTRDGENSLDYALASTAMMMCREGVARFMFITNDADFADIAKALRQQNKDVYLAGVGTEQANQTLRAAYNLFICYRGKHDKKARKGKERPYEKEAATETGMSNYENDDLKLQTNMPQQAAVVLSKGGQSKGKSGRKVKAGKQDKKAVKEAKAVKDVKDVKAVKAVKAVKEVKAAKTAKVAKSVEKKVQEVNGELAVRIPKSLHQQLTERAAQENVDMGQLVTFLLMQGISK